MTWNESRPRGDDQISDFGRVIRSQKSEFRAGIENHFVWDDASGLSAGEPRLQSGTTLTGSARGFYAAESVVSAFRDGALFVTSDTTRMYGLTSTESFLLGSSRAVRSDFVTTVGNHYTLIQDGTESVTIPGGSDHTVFDVTFPTVYNIAPTVIVTATIPDSNTNARASPSGITTGGFVMNITQETGVGSPGAVWRSVGTVDF